MHWDDPEGWDGEGRWEGGSGWGTHENPWLVHVNVWQKPLQYCKEIILQLIKINGKKIIINFDILKTQVSGSQGLLVGRNGGLKADIKVELEDA